MKIGRCQCCCCCKCCLLPCCSYWMKIGRYRCCCCCCKCCLLPCCSYWMKIGRCRRCCCCKCCLLPCCYQMNIGRCLRYNLHYMLPCSRQFANLVFCNRFFHLRLLSPSQQPHYPYQWNYTFALRSQRYRYPLYLHYPLEY